MLFSQSSSRCMIDAAKERENNARVDDSENACAR
jgi:hypothetical protein